MAPIWWEWGARKEQQCPLPSTSSHLPTFTYCCRGLEGKEESEQKEREVREGGATMGWVPGAWGLEWTRGGFEGKYSKTTKLFQQK